MRSKGEGSDPRIVLDIFDSLLQQWGLENYSLSVECELRQNHREEEGFIEEKLDHFFASDDWVLEFQSDQVHHMEKQSSDHSFLVLDSNPKVSKSRQRFFLDNRLWIILLS